jgi:hypothetical protein
MKGLSLVVLRVTYSTLFYSFLMHKLLLRLSSIYFFIVIVLQQENRIQEHCLIEFGLQASLT